MSKPSLASTVEQDLYDQFSDVADREHGSNAAAVRHLVRQAVNAGTTDLSATKDVENEDLLREIESLRADLDAEELGVTAVLGGSGSGSEPDDGFDVDVDVVDGLLDQYDPSEPVPEDLRPDPDTNSLAEEVLEQWAVKLGAEGDVPALNPDHVHDTSRRPTGEEHQIALGLGGAKYEFGDTVRVDQVLDVFEADGMWGVDYMRQNDVHRKIADHVPEIDSGRLAISDGAKAQVVKDARNDLTSSLTRLRDVDAMNRLQRRMNNVSQAINHYRNVVEETGMQVDENRDWDSEHREAGTVAEENVQQTLIENAEEAVDAAQDRLAGLNAEDCDRTRDVHQYEDNVLTKVRRAESKLDAVTSRDEHPWYYIGPVADDHDTVQELRDSISEIREEVEDWGDQTRAEVKAQQREQIAELADSVDRTMETLREQDVEDMESDDIEDARSLVEDYESAVRQSDVDVDTDVSYTSAEREIDEIEADLTRHENRKERERSKKKKREQKRENAERVEELVPEVKSLIDDLLVFPDDEDADEDEDVEPVLAEDWDVAYEEFVDAASEATGRAVHSELDEREVIEDLVDAGGETVQALVRDVPGDHVKPISPLWRRIAKEDTKISDTAVENWRERHTPSV